MRSQFRCNLLRSAQTCSYALSNAPRAQTPSPPLPLLHRFPRVHPIHPCSSVFIRGSIPARFSLLVSHFSHKKFRESKPIAPLSTTPPRKNKTNQTQFLAFESAGGKSGQEAVEKSVTVTGNTSATARAGPSHNYHFELLYQRRTRRARSVFQRLAPPTAVSISNGTCSG